MTPDFLSKSQIFTLRQYQDLLESFNQKINMISRDTTREQIWERHILHSLALATRPFPDGCVVVDWGSGGGLPALPLAVVLPKITVYAVDAVGKKMQTLRAMARKVGLTNLEAHHTRAEDFDIPIHYSVSRATAPLKTLWSWHIRVAAPWTGSLPPRAWPPGLICLKGGDLSDEIRDAQNAYPGLHVERYPLPAFLNDPYFDGKCILGVSASR